MEHKILGLGRSWTARSDISDDAMELMNHMRVIRFQVIPPSSVGEKKADAPRPPARLIYSNIELGEGAAWFVDTLNGLEKLHKIIIIALVGEEAEKSTSEDEMLDRVYKTYPPLVGLRKMEVAVEVEMWPSVEMRPSVGWCGVGRISVI